MSRSGNTRMRVRVGGLPGSGCLAVILVGVEVVAVAYGKVAVVPENQQVLGVLAFRLPGEVETPGYRPDESRWWKCVE